MLLDISMSTTILALRWFVLCARSEAWVVVWFCGGGDGCGADGHIKSSNHQYKDILFLYNAHRKSLSVKIVII